MAKLPAGRAGTVRFSTEAGAADSAVDSQQCQASPATTAELAAYCADEAGA